MQQSLERTIGQKKALGQEYTKEQAQLDKVNASLKTNQEAVVKNAEAYWKLKKSAEETSGGLDKVKSSLSSMGAPLVSATALAASAIAAFSRWNEVLNEAGLAQQNFAPGARSFATVARAMQGMVDRATEFNEALRLQETNFGRVEAASGRAISVIQQNTTAQKQALDAEKVLAEARLELRRQTDPNFSQQDFNAARRGLRAGFRQRGRGLELGEIDAEIKVKQAEFNEMMKQGRDAQRDKPALEARLQAAVDKQNGLAITGPRDTADLQAELEKNKQKMAFMDAVHGGAFGGFNAGAFGGKGLHEQFGLSLTDVEGLRGVSKSSLDARNKQIQSLVTDRIPRDAQRAGTAVADAQSKLADANRNIAATQPGAVYDQKTGEISGLLRQRGLTAGTLATSAAKLDEATGIRESAAEVSELKTNLAKDKSIEISLVKQIGDAVSHGQEQLAQTLRDTLEAIVKDMAAINRKIAKIAAQGAEAQQP